jgi:multiple sugar transport system substrate-binding protein
MTIQFEWQTRNDDDEWETITPRRRRRKAPRGTWWAVLAAVLLCATTITLIVRRRYRQAMDRITFQIQSVIDLEAQAFADGNVARFLAQQDEDAVEWYKRRQRLVASGSGDPDAAQEGVLPARIRHVELREDVAWVEVVEDNEPVRRMRFYRQTDRGWLHTAPDPAFWKVPVEVHYADQLIVRYHRQDEPHVKALADRLAQAYYTMCVTIGCPHGKRFEVAFYIQPPAESVPRHVLLLPSPWIGGIPLEGAYAEWAAEKSHYALAHRVVSASLSDYVIPPRTLRSAIADEYATWVSTGDLTQAPLLRRVIARHGTRALPNLLLWAEQGHSMAGFLARWLDLTPYGNEVPYFQTLLEIEHDALYAGRKDTFLLLQDDGRLRWLRDQKTRLEQVHVQEPLTRPDISVQMVEIGGNRARVTFDSGQSAAFAQSPAFFRHDDLNWVHTHPPYAPYTTYMPVPPAASDGNVVAVTFACWDPQHYQGLANVFHDYYGAPGTRITVDGQTRRYAEYPGIRIRLVQDNEIMQLSDFGAKTVHEGERRLVAAADAGDWRMSQEAIAEGLLRDLEPFIAADVSFGRADLYPHAFEAHRHGEGVWALPAYVTTSPIFYDREAFDVAGIPYPRPGWTHEDFLHAVQLLTSRDGDEIERYGFVDLAGSWREIILALVEPPSEDTPFVVPDLTAPDVVEAVRWYTDLALEHGVMPNPYQPPLVPGREESLRALIDQGSAAMWSDYLSNWGRMNRESNLGIAPSPTGRHYLQYWSSRGYFMSQNTAYPEASWTWLRFLTHQHSFGPRAQWYRYQVPARISTAEATRYWSGWDAETTDVLRYGLEYGSVYRWDESLTALSQAIEAVFDGTPVEEALAEAQTQLGKPGQEGRSPSGTAAARPVGYRP